MIRCNHCDVRIEDKAESRTVFEMNYRCLDVRDREPMWRNAYKETGQGDLCKSCQDEAFAGLEALAAEFGFVPTKEPVSEST